MSMLLVVLPPHHLPPEFSRWMRAEQMDTNNIHMLMYG
jgi:hypothetical protein